jgi:PAS domain S-box-containing protein
MLNNETHRLLKRQIATYCGDQEYLDKMLQNPKFEMFLKAVNQAYYEFDEDKKLLENIVHENQEELFKMNEELVEMNTKLEQRVAEKTQHLNDAFQELKEKEVRIRSIIENIAEVILIVDENYVVQFVSENFYEEIQFSEETLIGQDLNQLLSAEQLEDLNRIVNSGNTENPFFQITIPHAKKDNQSFDAIISIHNEYDKKEFIITLRNVTEMRKIQNQIKNQKEFYENILANIPADLAIFDSEHRYVFLNNKAIQDTELRAKIIGMTDFEYVQFRGGSPEMPALRHELFLEAISKKETIPFEEKLKDKLGNPKYMLRHFTPIFNSNSELENMIGLGIDITGRILAEQKIEELNQNLEEIVSKRTHQLELAIKELDAFAYSVSHDLRSPLRAVDGWSLALLEDYGDSLDAQAIEYISRVRSESQRMAELIDDLLNLSKIGKVQLKFKKIDFTAFCLKIINRELESSKRNDFEILVEEALSIFADENLLDIMMTNLITNAIKFSSKVEKPKITIGMKFQKDQYNVYYIKDNGAGFNSNLTQKLFGAFQRMHKQSDFPGTGIGLATVKRIVELHSGQIWADSQINEGATFTFKI